MKKIKFYTLGCRLNQSETAVIKQTFAKQNGFEVIHNQGQADIAVINTCTVTKNGDNDTRKLIARICRKNPDVQIALIGCQAQTQNETLAAFHNVRWVIGNALKMDLCTILSAQNITPDQAPEILVPKIPESAFTMPTASIDRRHTRANLKIQDGCNFFCSYCEIPYARGRARSRDFGDIQKEARILVNQGHQEIVLTGINIGCYKFQDYRLMDVIAALQEIDGLRRIRLSSIEPTLIPDGLFNMMEKKDSKICRYLHVPLQSADNKILKLMNRHYTIEEYKDLIVEALARVDGLCWGTDMIVGFPSENQQSFETTRAWLKELPIHYMHVFSFSRRLKAKARDLPDHVSIEEVQKRSAILRGLSKTKRQAFYKRLLGTQEPVLFEQKKNESWDGLTDNYARIYIKDTGKNLANKILDVQLNALDGEKISGNLVNT